VPRVSYIQIFRLECGILRTSQLWQITQFPASRLRSTSTGRQQTPRDRAGIVSASGIAAPRPRLSQCRVVRQIRALGFYCHSASGGPVAHRDSEQQSQGVIAYEPTEFLLPEEGTTLYPAPSLGLTLAPLVVRPVDFTHHSDPITNRLWLPHSQRAHPSERGYDLCTQPRTTSSCSQMPLTSWRPRDDLNLPDVGLRGNTHFAFSGT